MQQELSRPEWYALAAEEVLSRLESRPEGLTEDEVQQRLVIDAVTWGVIVLVAFLVELEKHLHGAWRRRERPAR